MSTVEIIFLAFILIGFSIWTWICWSAYKNSIREMAKQDALRKAKYGKLRPAYTNEDN